MADNVQYWKIPKEIDFATVLAPVGFFIEDKSAHNSLILDSDGRSVGKFENGNYVVNYDQKDFLQLASAAKLATVLSANGILYQSNIPAAEIAQHLRSLAAMLELGSIDTIVDGVPPPVQRTSEPVQPHPRDQKIDYFGFSSKVQHALKVLNVRTYGDLSNKSEAELCAVRHFGEKSLVEVEAKLAEKGLKLKVENPVLERELLKDAYSFHARHAFEALGARTYGDITKYTYWDLLSIQGVSFGAAREIEAKLAEKNLALSEDNLDRVPYTDVGPYSSYAFSATALNAFRALGIEKYRDFKRVSLKDFERLGLHRNTVAHIINKLDERGIGLKRS